MGLISIAQKVIRTVSAAASSATTLSSRASGDALHVAKELAVGAGTAVAEKTFASLVAPSDELLYTLMPFAYKRQMGRRRGGGLLPPANFSQLRMPSIPPPSRSD